jgi:hypothetical protein
MLIQQKEIILKKNLDNLRIPSLASYESGTSQQTSVLMQKYAQMMENFEMNNSDLQ